MGERAVGERGAVKILRWIFKAQAAQKECKSFVEWLGFKAKKHHQMAGQDFKAKKRLKAEPNYKKLS